MRGHQHSDGLSPRGVVFLLYAGDLGHGAHLGLLVVVEGLALLASLVTEEATEDDAVHLAVHLGALPGHQTVPLPSTGTRHTVKCVQQ